LHKVPTRTFEPQGTPAAARRALSVDDTHVAAWASMLGIGAKDRAPTGGRRLMIIPKRKLLTLY